MSLRHSLGLALLISLSACATAEPSLTTAKLAGQPVSLLDQQGQCAVRSAEQTLLLDMAWPCSLSADRKGVARVERFNGVPIVLVEQITPAAAPSQDCLKHAQAVRLHEGRLQASVLSRSASCDRGVQDQKMFTGLFAW